MRFRVEKERRGLLLRCWSNDYHEGEIAYAVLGLRGPRAEIEFPSDWHEHSRAWIRIGLGLFSINFSFPWRKVVPDQGQCSGPTYGFYFFERALVLQYGKMTGRRGDPQKYIHLPWSWEHIRHDYLNSDGSLHHRAARGEYEVPASTTEQHPYRYVLRSGEVQDRIATVNGEEREWRWRGTQRLPWPRKIRRTINVAFNDEVGERTGSWKGGVLGTAFEWHRGESMRDALDRMQREEKFR